MMRYRIKIKRTIIPLILLFVFIILNGCSRVISEKKIWNQDHTHYINTVYYTCGITCGRVSVFVDRKEYLSFETNVVLEGRWINENEIKIVSNIKPMKNRINECPISIQFKVADKYTDFVSDTLLQVLREENY